MAVKNTTFCLKSDEIFVTFVLLSFTKKWTRWNAGNSSEWPLGIQSKTAEHLSLIPRSSPLSNMTAEAGGVQDVKFLTHVRFTKSNLRGLPPTPPPPPSPRAVWPTCGQEPFMGLVVGHGIYSEARASLERILRCFISWRLKPAVATKNEKSKDYYKADLKQRVLFFITIFRLTIPAFFRFTDPTFTTSRIFVHGFCS